MKRSIGNIIHVVEIVINLCLLPLFYVKFFHRVELVFVTSETGELLSQRIDKYYSIIDNLKYDPLFFVPMSVALIILSITVSIFSIFMKNRNMRTAGHIFAACSVFLFLFIFFIACLVQSAMKTP